tara:strand:- start:845 stop:1405 length:561 start_codon:yes stop_codon:yes gene_type:complete
MKITKNRIKEIVREELAELRNISEETTLTGKEVADKIKNSKDKGHKMFFGKKALTAIAKQGKLTAKKLDQMLPDYIPGNLIHGLFNENINEYVDTNLLTKRQTRIVTEMRPHTSKDLPGASIWQHISDHYDWEDYLGKGGMKELEKSLKKMKRVKPQQLDQMLPGYIPADEVYDIFRNSLAIGPTE